MKSTITILGSLCLLGSVAAAPLPGNSMVQGEVPDFLGPVTVPINAEVDNYPTSGDVDADRRRQLPGLPNLPVAGLTNGLTGAGGLTSLSHEVSPQMFGSLLGATGLPTQNIGPRRLSRVARVDPFDGEEKQASSSLPQEVKGDLNGLFKLDISSTDNVGPRTLIDTAAGVPDVAAQQIPHTETGSGSGSVPQDVKSDLDQLLNLGITPQTGTIHARQLPGGLPGLSSLGALNPIKNSGIGSVAGTLDKTLGGVAAPLKNGGISNLPETLTKSLNGVHVNGA